MITKTQTQEVHTLSTGSYAIIITARDSVYQRVNNSPELMGSIVSKTLSPKVETRYTDSGENKVSTGKFSLAHNVKTYTVEFTKTETPRGYLTLQMNIRAKRA